MMQDLLISQTYSSFVAYIEHSYQGGTITNRKKKKTNILVECKMAPSMLCLIHSCKNYALI